MVITQEFSAFRWICKPLPKIADMLLFVSRPEENPIFLNPLQTKITSPSFCYSLSLLSTNLSGVQETELRTFMAKRLTRGTVYSGSGNINTLENFFPDELALCYYCLLRGGKENGEEYRDQQEMYVFS